ncbi:hypothetical protein [Heliophilum fasciatum]|uniref:Uncharacterized protein n=1 Tax=Heliophilum fasciatum TaxID=35700 RepID=A0A4V6NRP4_9FIRM|nr:hypothetical protein [Heliophilum fasciatum]MCW2277618.1 hypothetical protein [Heliophilum fasciatum]TCP64966.1 hypothetical protein EDD73_10736 [Heliophilum fasciatum]
MRIEQTILMKHLQGSAYPTLCRVVPAMVPPGIHVLSPSERRRFASSTYSSYHAQADNIMLIYSICGLTPEEKAQILASTVRLLFQKRGVKSYPPRQCTLLDFASYHRRRCSMQRAGFISLPKKRRTNKSPRPRPH